MKTARWERTTRGKVGPIRRLHLVPLIFPQFLWCKCHEVVGYDRPGQEGVEIVHLSTICGNTVVISPLGPSTINIIMIRVSQILNFGGKRTHVLTNKLKQMFSLQTSKSVRCCQR